MSGAAEFPISAHARDNTVTPEAIGEIRMFAVNFDQSYIQAQRGHPDDSRAFDQWDRTILAIQDTQCYVQEYHETDRRDRYETELVDVRPGESGIKVNRYAIDPVSARPIACTYNGRGALHPTEQHLFASALRDIEKRDRVVMVDMYAKDKDGNIRQDPQSMLPETHTVALFTDNQDHIVLLDPSNTTFSDYLVPLLNRLCQEKKIEKSVISVNVSDDKVYQVANPEVTRDCISVALAAANHIAHEPGIEANEVIKRIANVPRAIVPGLTKGERKNAADAIQRLQRPVALGQHSTDMRIRDVASQEIISIVEDMRKSPVFSAGGADSRSFTTSSTNPAKKKVSGRGQDDG